MISSLFSFTAKRIISVFKILKITLLIVAVFGFIISIFYVSLFKGHGPILKTDNSINKSRDSIYKIINDKSMKSTKEGQLSIAGYRIFTCTLIGEGCTDNPEDGNKNYNQSILGFSANLLIIPYTNPPASGIYWAYSGLQNAGFIPKTYAQSGGIGFASLSAFSNLWNAFRKIAYLILVLIIVAIGFMIMFRAKMNPQTVISIENALPRIIIAIILITFSFPIAGFLIDMMYFVTFVGIEILASSGGVPGANVAEIKNNIINSGLTSNILDPSMAVRYFGGLRSLVEFFPIEVRAIFSTIIGFIAGILGLIYSSKIQGVFAGAFGHLQAGVDLMPAGIGVDGKFNIALFIATGFAIVASLFLGYIIINVFFLIVVILGLVFLIFRIFFTLLTCLINIILYVMFAPLILMFVAIPGKNVFGGWIKNIIGNLVVFPACVFLVMLVKIIANTYDQSRAVFTPPFLNQTNTNAIAALIAITMLLMIPDLLQMLKQMIIGKDGFQLPMNVGAMFGAATATGGFAMQSMSQLYYLQQGIGFFTGHKDAHGNSSGGLIQGLGEGLKKVFHK